MGLLIDAPPRESSRTSPLDDLVNVARELERVTERLVHELCDTLPPVVFTNHVAHVAAGFQGATVLRFIPLLVERQVRRELGAHRRVGRA